MTCWSCGEKGHFQADCTRPKRKQNHKLEDDDDSINLAKDIWGCCNPSVMDQIKKETKILRLSARPKTSANLEFSFAHDPRSTPDVGITTRTKLDPQPNHLQERKRKRESLRKKQTTLQQNQTIQNRLQNL